MPKQNAPVHVEPPAEDRFERHIRTYGFETAGLKRWTALVSSAHREAMCVGRERFGSRYYLPMLRAICAAVTIAACALSLSCGQTCKCNGDVCSDCRGLHRRLVDPRNVLHDSTCPARWALD